MTQRIPLHEAIRPRGGRDASGADGEALHQVADVLEMQENPIFVDAGTDYATLAAQLAKVHGSYDFTRLRNAAVKILNKNTGRPQMTLGELQSQQGRA